MTSVLFDFNGTISDDEPLLCAIFQELFADAGKPLDEDEYFDRLAGLSDAEIVLEWLGEPDPAVVDRKIARYRERAADGSTVDDETRRAVLLAAEHGPVAVVSGAARSEIEPVLAAAGLVDAVKLVVSMEDVPRGKPEPDGYLRALELLGLSTRRSSRDRGLAAGGRRSAGGRPPLRCPDPHIHRGTARRSGSAGGSC